MNSPYVTICTYKMIQSITHAMYARLCRDTTRHRASTAGSHAFRVCRAPAPRAADAAVSSAVCARRDCPATMTGGTVAHWARIHREGPTPAQTRNCAPCGNSGREEPPIGAMPHRHRQRRKASCNMPMSLRLAGQTVTDSRASARAESSLSGFRPCSEERVGRVGLDVPKAGKGGSV